MNGGKLLGKGTIGQVFTIKNNNKNVIKVSRKGKQYELKQEFKIFKSLKNLLSKEFLNRFFITSNKSINKKKKKNKFLNNLKKKIKKKKNLNNMLNNLNKKIVNNNLNNQEMFSFILERGIPFKKYKDNLNNINKTNIEDVFNFKIFYKLLICYNVCLEYNIGNFDVKPSNTIIKKINDTNEIISIDYDNTYFIQNKKDLIKFKLLAPGYTYYWPPEFWKYNENSNIKDYLTYYYPKQDWKDIYIELNNYIKNTEYTELISKGMVWHLIHSFFFSSFYKDVILTQNIMNSSNNLLKYKEIKELFLKGLTPHPKTRINLMELTIGFELIAKKGTFGKEIQSYFTSDKINLSQIFGLNYKEGNYTDIINNTGKSVSHSIVEYYLSRPKTGGAKTQKKSNNSKPNVRKPSKQNVRKHKGIYQSGPKSGKLKPGYKYSGKKTKTGLKIIV